MKFSILTLSAASSLSAASVAYAAGAAYFLTNGDDGNYVVASTIGSNGQLSAGKATWAGGRGQHANSTGFDPLLSQGPVIVRGSNLYTVNAASNTISMFAIDETDPSKLTMVSGPVSSQGEFPISIAASPTSGNVCVLNGGAVNSVACFTPDPARGLVSLPNTYREIGVQQTSPPAGPPGSATQVIFTLDGKRLVASVKGVPPAPGFLAVWDVRADGSLSVGFDAITPPSGASLLFGFETLPHNPSVLVVTDPSISGYNIIDLGSSLAGRANGTTGIESNAVRNVQASGVSSMNQIPGSAAVCWTAFSPRTGNFYMIDPGTSTITEIMVNSNTLKPSMVKQYDAGANGNTLDAMVATVNGNDYLYVLAPNRTSIEVFSLRAVGSAQRVQTFDYSGTISDAGIPFQNMNVAGMATYSA